MTEIMNAKLTSSLLPQTASEIALRWGWKSPTPKALELAEEVLSARKLRSGELFVKWGVMTAEAVERLARVKPESKPIIAWLGEKNSDAALYVERALAVKMEMPYYDLSMLQVHPNMLESGIAKRAEELDVAVMQIEQDVPVLVFSSIAGMSKYRAMGRDERHTDPLWKVVGEKAQFAIGARDEISAVIKQARSANDSGELEDTAHNFFAAQNQSNEETREISRLIDYGISLRSSDMSLVPFRNGTYMVQYRKNGRLIKPKSVSEVIKPELAQRMLAALESKSGANPSNTVIRVPTNGRITYVSGNVETFLRFSFIPTNHPGDRRNLKSVSARLFPRAETTVDLDKLHLQSEVVAAIKSVMRMGQGMLLVVGPTNSGKSTTIAGAIGYHVAHFGDSKKRVSLESPIERFLFGIRQFEPPPNMTQDEGYLMMLKAFKRHDLDLLWLGEILGRETADNAVSATVSGLLTGTTLHATDTMLGFAEIARQVTPDIKYQCVSSLSLVLSQRLVPELCPHCSKVSKTTDEEKQIYAHYTKMKGIVGKDLPSKLAHPDLKGCDQCWGGYVGESPINEILLFDQETKDIAMDILSGMPRHRELAGRRSLTLLESGLRMVFSHRTDLSSLMEALPL